MKSWRGRFIFLAALLALGFLLIPIISYQRNIMLDYNYPPAKMAIRHTAVAIFGFLFLGYGLYLKTRQLYPITKVGPLYFAGILFLGLFLCSIYPIFSIDLYEYIIRGRIFSIYHANPYLHPPSDFKQDIYYKVIFWKYQPMVYGPVWAYLVSSVAAITRNSVFFTQFFIKFLIFIFHVLTSVFIYKTAKELRLERPLVITEAFLLNPFILTMALVDGHLDTIMIFFLVSSIFLLYKNRFYAAFMLLALSFLTKYLTVILLPFYFIYMFGAMEKKNLFLKKAFLSFMVMAATTVLVYRPLWAGLGIFSGLKIVRTGFDSNTFPYIFYTASSFIIQGLSRDLFRYISYALFVLIYILSLLFFIRTEDKRRGLLSSVLVIFSGYILFASFQLGAWYFLWIIPFLLFSRLPLKYLLVGLISFASLISFWKRVSFLIITALFVYAAALFRRRIRCTRP